MVVGDEVGEGVGVRFRRYLENFVEEFGFYVVGSGELLKDLSRVMI